MAADETKREMRAHERTYSLFITLIKYGAIVSLVTALLVILFISD
ncbi:MAG: aa3-type cytochrome c oxidase subunit IV [Sphingosinicella sp.]